MEYFTTQVSTYGIFIESGQVFLEFVFFIVHVTLCMRNKRNHRDCFVNERVS